MKPMRIAAGLILAGLAGAGTASGQAAPQIEIRGAVARVVISPQPRPDITAQIIMGDPRLRLKVRRHGGKLIIDGGIKRDRIHGCQAHAGPDGRMTGEARIGGLGQVAWGQMPQILISAPRHVKVTASGAVFGSVGRADTLELANEGCGDWTLGDVQGRLRVSQAGDGASRAGRAGSAQLRVAGAGGASMGAVSGEVDIEMAGSGIMRVASVDGPLKVKLAGSGGAFIQGGHASAMTATVAGSGGVTFGGVAQSLKASIAGSGDIRAAKVLGRVEKQTIGSGKVLVGG